MTSFSGKTRCLVSVAAMIVVAKVLFLVTRALLGCHWSALTGSSPKSEQPGMYSLCEYHIQCMIYHKDVNKIKP